MMLCEVLGFPGGFSAATLWGVGVCKCEVSTLTRAVLVSFVMSLGEMLCSFEKNKSILSLLNQTNLPILQKSKQS